MVGEAKVGVAVSRSGFRGYRSVVGEELHCDSAQWLVSAGVAQMDLQGHLCEHRAKCLQTRSYTRVKKTHRNHCIAVFCLRARPFASDPVHFLDSCQHRFPSNNGPFPAAKEAWDK